MKKVGDKWQTDYFLWVVPGDTAGDAADLDNIDAYKSLYIDVHIIITGRKSTMASTNDHAPKMGFGLPTTNSTKESDEAVVDYLLPAAHGLDSISCLWHTFRLYSFVNDSLPASLRFNNELDFHEMVGIRVGNFRVSKQVSKQCFMIAFTDKTTALEVLKHIYVVRATGWRHLGQDLVVKTFPPNSKLKKKQELAERLKAWWKPFQGKDATHLVNLPGLQCPKPPHYEMGLVQSVEGCLSLAPYIVSRRVRYHMVCKSSPKYLATRRRESWKMSGPAAPSWSTQSGWTRCCQAMQQKGWTRRACCPRPSRAWQQQRRQHRPPLAPPSPDTATNSGIGEVIACLSKAEPLPAAIPGCDPLWYRKYVFPVSWQTGRYKYYVCRANGRAEWSNGIYQQWCNIFPHVNGVSAADHEKFNSKCKAVAWFQVLNPGVTPRLAPKGESPWAQMPAWEAARFGGKAVPPPATKKRRPTGTPGPGQGESLFEVAKGNIVWVEQGAMPPPGATNHGPPPPRDEQQQSMDGGADDPPPPPAPANDHPQRQAETLAALAASTPMAATGSDPRQVPLPPVHTVDLTSLTDSARDSVKQDGEGTLSMREDDDKENDGDSPSSSSSLYLSDSDDDDDSTYEDADGGDTKSLAGEPATAKVGLPLTVAQGNAPTRFLAIRDMPEWADPPTIQQAFGDIDRLAGVQVSGGGICLLAL